MLEHMDSLLTKLTAAFPIPIRHYQNGCLIKGWGQWEFAVDIAKCYLDPYIGGRNPLCFVVSPEYVLSGYLSLGREEDYLTLGPSFPYEMTDRQGERILRELELSPSLLSGLRRFFHFVPQMSATNFQNLLAFLYEMLFPNLPEEPIHLTYQASHIDLFDKKEFIINEDMNSRIEETLMPLVAAGMLSEAENALESLFNASDSYLPSLAPSNIRALKNTLIASTAIISRTSMQGGLDYRTAMTLSDYYIAKIEGATLISELYELLRTMILDYTRRISILSRPETISPVVNAVYREVQLHKHEKITCKTIAEHLAFSSSYISHHFKDVTGITLTEYIHQQKIKEVQYLLDTTNLSLAAISEKMGFSSQQQLQLVFKQITGMTPKQYQNRSHSL